MRRSAINTNFVSPLIKYFLATAIFSSFMLLSGSVKGQVRINLKGKSPQPVINNAFCEAYLQDMPFLFSFGGSDRIQEPAINFRYNALTGEIKELPAFPDGGKLNGGKASLVGDIVLIIGGRKAGRNNHRVYRYDQGRHVFLSNGETIPYPVTQHGQAKYRDSLLFVVGGTGTAGPVNAVQVYDPLFDSWNQTTPLPQFVIDADEAFYTAVICRDTLHVLAHLTLGQNTTHHLFRAALNPLNTLEWQHHILPDSLRLKPPVVGTTVRNEVHWIASQFIPENDSTYTVDFTLDSQGGVDKWMALDKTPGGFNGIARVSDTIQFLVGGVYPDGDLSEDIYMLTWTNLGTGTSLKLIKDRRFYLYPNPCNDYIRIQSVRDELEAKGIEVFNMQGRKLLNSKVNNRYQRFSFRSFQERAFIVRIFDNEGNYYVDKILKTN